MKKSVSVLQALKRTDYQSVSLVRVLCTKNCGLYRTHSVALAIDDIFHALVICAAMPFLSSISKAAVLITRAQTALTPSKTYKCAAPAPTVLSAATAPQKERPLSKSESKGFTPRSREQYSSPFCSKTQVYPQSSSLWRAVRIPLSIRLISFLPSRITPSTEFSLSF